MKFTGEEIGLFELDKKIDQELKRTCHKAIAEYKPDSIIEFYALNSFLIIAIGYHMAFEILDWKSKNVKRLI